MLRITAADNPPATPVLGTESDGFEPAEDALFEEAADETAVLALTSDFEDVSAVDEVFVSALDGSASDEVTASDETSELLISLLVSEDTSDEVSDDTSEDEESPPSAASVSFVYVTP